MKEGSEWCLRVEDGAWGVWELGMVVAVGELGSCRHE